MPCCVKQRDPELPADFERFGFVEIGCDVDNFAQIGIREAISRAFRSGNCRCGANVAVNSRLLKRPVAIPACDSAGDFCGVGDSGESSD